MASADVAEDELPDSLDEVQDRAPAVPSRSPTADHGDSRNTRSSSSGAGRDMNSTALGEQDDSISCSGPPASPGNLSRTSPKSKSMSALGSYADLRQKTSFSNVATDGVKKDGTYMAHFSNFKTGPKYTMSKRPTSFVTSSSTPAPGSYNATGEGAAKLKSDPCFSFGGSSRFGLGQSPTKKMPGPGSYNPRDPTRTEMKVGFGSSSRGKAAAAEHNPGPGAYEFRSDLGNGRMFTAGGRHASSEHRSRSLPGPGAYTPSQNSVLQSTPKCGFGTSMRQDSGAAMRSSYQPGPGTYELQNFKSTGSDAPKFSATSRRRVHDLNSYVTPGPGSYNSHVTQFGY